MLTPHMTNTYRISFELKLNRPDELNTFSLIFTPELLRPSGRHSIENMIWGLVAQIAANPRMISWCLPFNAPTTNQCLYHVLTNDYEHSLGLYQSGSVTLVRHRLNDSQHITITDDTITMPDGSLIEISQFAPKAAIDTPLGSTRDVREIKRATRTETIKYLTDQNLSKSFNPVSQLVIGVLQHALPLDHVYGSYASGIFNDKLLALSGRAARLLDYPGRKNSSKCFEGMVIETKSVLKNLYKDKVLEPNRYHLPTHIYGTELFDQIIKHLDLHWLTISKAIHDGLMTMQWIDKSPECIATGDPDPSFSNHQILQAKAEIRALDHLILENVPISSLSTRGKGALGELQKRKIRT